MAGKCPLVGLKGSMTVSQTPNLPPLPVPNMGTAGNAPAASPKKGPGVSMAVDKVTVSRTASASPTNTPQNAPTASAAPAVNLPPLNVPLVGTVPGQASPAPSRAKPSVAKPAAPQGPAIVAAPKPAKRAPAVDTRAESKTNVGWKIRLTGYMTMFTTLATSWIFNPQLLVSHVKTIFGQIYRMAGGAKRVHGWATGYAEARKAGTARTYVRGVADEVSQMSKRTAVSLKDKALGLFGHGKDVAKAAPAAVEMTPTVVLEANKGLIGWYRAARAAGAGRLSALASGLDKTIETGGDMPSIMAKAQGQSGWWAKAFVATGKAARLAPLLNLPIAALDLIHARQIAKDPLATPRLRAAKIGQAIFSSSAAALSVAAFLVPAPFDMLALKAAGWTGLGSLAWSVLSSRPVMNLGIKITNFLHIGPHREPEVSTGKD